MLTDELPFSADHDVGLEPVAVGQLPARLRLLCVGTREPSWITLTLQFEKAGTIVATVPVQAGPPGQAMPGAHGH